MSLRVISCVCNLQRSVRSALMKKPELLSPAGDYSALTYAIQYGADAVYIGGEDFSLRAASQEFFRART